ncbi:TrkA family potassium uptake protein [uncultured Methanosphaera sp.]|jgi:trk system potassium uptake protein TrkA|uniref:potassium channel family protein n=1 Tax=Methanosphaera sp. TaxID=2666342 RepID=UPI000DC38B06|nr:TrkA family potassium uptake protein [uncultured Methanosphaera sp.]MDY2744116.1 TrkA family potassium uptake protein [Methanosphaera sp.]RAP44310.1 MAG: potassium transporter TrkA [Methanosphaera sp. SHI1033]
MYVIIVGAGRVGLNLAQSLVREGLNVTIIEHDPTKSEEVAETINAMVIQGDATSVNVLENAGIIDADVFVAATGHDSVNLLTSVLCQKYDNIKKIIARVNDLEHVDAFKQVGVDVTVSPESTVASYLERIITRPKVADLIVLGRGSTELLDLKIENKDLFGKRILDYSPTENYIVCAIYEDNELVIPQEDTLFHEDQKISVLTKSDYVQEVTQFFAP